MPLNFGSAHIKREHVHVAVLVDVSDERTVYANNLEVVGRITLNVHGFKLRLVAQSPAELYTAPDSGALPDADSVGDPAKNIGHSVAVKVCNMNPLVVFWKASGPFGALCPLSTDAFKREPTSAFSVEDHQVVVPVAVDICVKHLWVIQATRSS